MTKLFPPHRADQIGSLKRPRDLLDMRAKLEKGEGSVEELHKIEDRAILDIIAMQREIGMKTITDGEFRR